MHTKHGNNINDKQLGNSVRKPVNSSYMVIKNNHFKGYLAA